MNIFLVVGCVVLLFGLVVLRGAPYVPSHKKAISTALDALDLDPGDTVVDLGSGDGAFLKMAASRGLRAIGYELNPILCLIAIIRCWPVRNLVSVRLRDFWLSGLPSETKAVYFFLAGPFMYRIKRTLQRDVERQARPLRIASNGFSVPTWEPQKIVHGVYLYEIKP